jgi:hypothetical protein
LKHFKLFGKLSIVLVIFFSLQGEVVQRYADLFLGKPEHRASVPKKTANRQQLIKLQCYTKRFLLVALPFGTCYEFCLPVRSIARTSYIIADRGPIELPHTELPFLRGPPAVNS